MEREDRLAGAEGPLVASRALAHVASRSMRLQFTIQDGHVLVADAAASVALDLQVLKAMVASR
jgi:uncharacterized protein YaeQ